VWDFAGRRLVTTLTGHLAPVRFVAVAPDGSAFLSGSDDGTVRLWTISNGRPTATP
jgi:WD40 repeat protein